jgi:hypothetical protein
MTSYWQFSKLHNKTDSFRYSWRIVSLMPITFGFAINIYTLAAMMSLFLPIMGRCGAETPAEVVIAGTNVSTQSSFTASSIDLTFLILVLISVTCAMTGIGILPAAHWAGHFRRVLKAFTIFLVLVILLACLTSPYTSLRPKRVAIQHTSYYHSAKFNQPLNTLPHESHTLLIHVDPINFDKIFKTASEKRLTPPGFQPVKFKLPHRDLTTVYPLDSFMGGGIPTLTSFATTF